MSGPAIGRSSEPTAAPRTLRVPPETLSEIFEEDMPGGRALEKTEYVVRTADERVCKCVRCGRTTLSPKQDFWANPKSSVFARNQGHVDICRDCLREMYNEMVKAGYPAVNALRVICHYGDWHYDRIAASESATQKDPVGSYVRRASASRDWGSYADQTLRGAIGGAELEDDEWDDLSRKNRAYVLGIVGYDPFLDASYTEADRKFLFNTMAGYCPDSSIGDESHKLQSVVNIVISQLQVQKVNRQLNMDLASLNADQTAIEKMTAVQKNLLQSIDRMAKENEISAASGASSKGSNTLTDRMRRIVEDGFRDIEVNMFDVRTADCMRQVADISANAIVREMRLEDNDWSEIVTELRDARARLEEENAALREELRIARNSLAAGGPEN